MPEIRYERTTIRFESRVKAGLQELCDRANVTMNSLVNEAVGMFVEQRLADEAAELEGLLADIRSYRRQDPRYEKAIARIVKSEKSGLDDPAEGVVTSVAPTPAEEALDILNG